MLEHYQPYVDYAQLIEQQAQEISDKIKPQEEPKIKVKNKPYQPVQRRPVLKIGRK